MLHHVLYAKFADNVTLRVMNNEHVKTTRLKRDSRDTVPRDYPSSCLKLFSTDHSFLSLGNVTYIQPILMRHAYDIIIIMS